MNARRLPRIAGITFLVILFLAPGFGVQYFLWFLPFLAFLFDRPAALALNALVSLFVFWLYTSWAKGWPWVYAEGGTNSPAVGMFGLVVWLAIGCSVVAGLRHLYGRRAEADA